MSRLARIPPGRAGRLWLRRRLDTAERGREQLDHKLRILSPELQRLRINADRRRAEWTATVGDANNWLLRAELLSGQDVLRAAEPAHLADVELIWETVMGLSYPVEAKAAGPLGAAPFVAGNAAILLAAEAFSTALVAGVRTAAAQEAVRRVEAETATTRLRLRALERRWLPWLNEALARLELSLEQAEQEDSLRLRRSGTAPTRPQVTP